MDAVDRIKLLRGKDFYNLNQMQFANQIGISRSNLANIETRKVKLTERVAKDICKEFKINYLWLLEGKGEPFTETPEDIFDEVKKEYNLNDSDIELLKEYSEMSSDERNSLIGYIKSLIRTKKEGD